MSGGKIARMQLLLLMRDWGARGRRRRPFIPVSAVGEHLQKRLAEYWVQGLVSTRAESLTHVYCWRW